MRESRQELVDKQESGRGTLPGHEALPNPIGGSNPIGGPKPVYRQDSWQNLADGQAGLVARRQLLALGWTPAQARQRVTTGHWVRVLPGVYATFTGPRDELCRIWAAILYGDGGAGEVAASHETALWLAGLLDRAPAAVHVSIPYDRHLRGPDWIRWHRRRELARDRHPAARPPQIRLDESVLDCCDLARSAETVLGLVLTATQRRLTTSIRLRTTLLARARHHWRPLLTEVLAEVEAGVASALEHRYLRDVERRHRLPHGERNIQETAPDGTAWYRDVRYRRYATVVELDGIMAHPIAENFRDLRRDNLAVVRGETVLRYGWRDVVTRPCATAAQVALVLRSKGWQARPHPCSASCDLA